MLGFGANRTTICGVDSMAEDTNAPDDLNADYAAKLIGEYTGITPPC
jgi:hypothetical protein